MRALDWRAAARCVGKTELFFGPVNERAEARRRREDQARQLCGHCPVTRPCREWARHHGEYGIWGGETDEDRAAGQLPARPTPSVSEPAIV
ncbi:MAG: WhiB family transcriptional regulator [Actinomycetota bacterium]|jgi:WhiB family transcriptional regulator, redox-sensing transcriptional regulator